MNSSLSSLLSSLSLFGVAHAIVAPAVLDEFAGAGRMSRHEMLWLLHKDSALRAYFSEIVCKTATTAEAASIVTEFAAAQGGAS